MEYRSSEIKAGMFIFVGVIALMALIASLSNISEWFSPDKRELGIIFNFADGLEVGAPVRYAGLDVGRVKEITLEGKEGAEKDRVIAVVEIDPAYKIKKDSTASIKTAGLMGGFYVDIKPGSKNSPELEKDQMLEGQDSFEFAKIGDAVNKFVMIADDLSSHLKTTLSNVNLLLSDNRKELKQSLKSIHEVSSELSQILSQNKENIRKGVKNFASFTGKADALMNDKAAVISDTLDQLYVSTKELEIMLTENRPAISKLVRNLESGSKRLDETLKSVSTRVDSVSERLDETLETVSTNVDSVGESVNSAFRQGNAIMVENRRNLLLLIKNLKETSANLKELSGDVKRNPWKLIRKSDEIPFSPQEEIKPTLRKEDLRMKRLDKSANK